jgi:hypothetical protein
VSSISRVYTFTNDKQVSPVKLEIELSNLINTWNNHEQGIQQHSGLWTAWFRFTPTIKTSAGSYVVLSSDAFIVINKTVGAATTVTLEASPTSGRLIIVKDGKGDAAANNITVDGNGKNIDGASTNVISTNFQARIYIYNGTQWNVISGS